MREDHDLLVVGYDLGSGEEVHIGDQPLEHWRARGYGRAEQVVCLYCWNGVDAPSGTRVPLLARGRIGGLVRPHFAHPPGTAPVGGHHPETVWHVTAKHRLARWARSLPQVARVQLERWTPGRERRADVWVQLHTGAVLALEAQSELITDELWQARHRDYAANGIRNVWFLRPGTRVPHVLFAEGIPAWTLYHREGEAAARLGEPHWRGPQWWTKELRLFAPHHPPCAGDPVTTERFALGELGLDAGGVTLPPRVLERLADAVARVRGEADAAGDAAARARRARPNTAVRSPARTPRRPAPAGPRCEVCGLRLAEVLASGRRHVLC